MKIKNFRDLIVWQKAMILVKEIYKFSGQFPNEEKFGLTNQIRRAVVSVPSNISEGYGRGAKADYKRFLQISLGSLYEVETQLEISFMLGYCRDKTQYDNLLEKIIELEKILFTIIKKLSHTT